jgi:hypothetical protein
VTINLLEHRRFCDDGEEQAILEEFLLGRVECDELGLDVK